MCDKCPSQIEMYLYASGYPDIPDETKDRIRKHLIECKDCFAEFRKILKTPQNSVETLGISGEFINQKVSKLYQVYSMNAGKSRLYQHLIFFLINDSQKISTQC